MQKMVVNNKFYFWLCFFISVTVLSFVFFFELGTLPFGNHDETIHASVIYNMFSTGDFLHPKLNGADYFNKPPLKMWLTLIGLHIFGVSHFTFRFLDALAGVGTGIVIFLFVYVCLKSSLAALFSSFIFISTKIFIFHHVFRNGTQDGPLVFLSTLALCLTWIFIKQLDQSKGNIKILQLSKKATLVGFLIGCGVLCKSIAGFLPLVVIYIFSVFLFVEKNYRKELFIFLFVVSGVSFAIAFLWYLHVFLYSTACSKCVLEIERFEEGFHNSSDSLFYVKRLFEGFYLPPFIILVPTIWGALYALKYCTRELLIRYLLCWGCCLFFIISCLSSRVVHYMAPAIPAFIILASIFSHYLFRKVTCMIHKQGIIKKFFSICIFFCLCFFSYQVLSTDYKYFQGMKKKANVVKRKVFFYNELLEKLSSIENKNSIYFLESKKRFSFWVRLFYEKLYNVKVITITSKEEAQALLNEDKNNIIIVHSKKALFDNGFMCLKYNSVVWKSFNGDVVYFNFIPKGWPEVKGRCIKKQDFPDL